MLIVRIGPKLKRNSSSLNNTTSYQVVHLNSSRCSSNNHSSKWCSFQLLNKCTNNLSKCNNSRWCNSLKWCSLTHNNKWCNSQWWWMVDSQWWCNNRWWCKDSPWCKVDKSYHSKWCSCLRHSKCINSLRWCNNNQLCNNSSNQSSRLSKVWSKLRHKSHTSLKLFHYLKATPWA